MPWNGLFVVHTSLIDIFKLAGFFAIMMFLIWFTWSRKR